MAFYLNDIYTFLLMFSSIMFSALMMIDKNRLLLLLEYGFNQKYSLKYHQKESRIYVIATSINTLMLLTILTSFYVFNNNNGVMSLFMFSKIAILLFFFYLTRMTVIYYIAMLFEVQDYGQKYYYSYNVGLFLLSLLFLPIIIFVSYYNNGVLLDIISEYLFYAFFLFYIILKLITLNRLNLFTISLIFYNILYLCALEVLPYLGLIKLLDLI